MTPANVRLFAAASASDTAFSHPALDCNFCPPEFVVDTMLDRGSRVQLRKARRVVGFHRGNESPGR